MPSWDVLDAELADAVERTRASGRSRATLRPVRELREHELMTIVRRARESNGPHRVRWPLRARLAWVELVERTGAAS